MEFSQMILYNFTTITLLIGLLVIILSNKSFDKRTNTTFIMFICCTILLIIAGCVDNYTATLPHPSIIRYIASATGYTLRPAALVILINAILRRQKQKFILWIPVIYVGILSFTSYFTHLMFWWTDDNKFCRGQMLFKYSAHIVSIFYLIILIFAIIKVIKHITTNEIFAIFYSIFICTIATVLETVMNNQNFFITSAMTVSGTLYYMILYLEMFRRDSLTGLLNRKSYNIKTKKYKNKQFAIISIDLNNLKTINDSHGHNAGDIALKNLADSLVKCCKKDYYPYRVGGDEFIVLVKENDKEKIENYINNVQKLLEKEQIMAAMGYAFYKPGDNIQYISIQADEQMYKQKAILKS